MATASADPGCIAPSGDAPVSRYPGVPVDDRLVTGQPRTCHLEIVHVGRRRHHRVDEARVRVDPDVRLQDEEPLVPFPGLVPDGGRMLV